MSQNIDSDARYGPGWYATTLAPDTSTDTLLRELWQGNVKHIAKTEYWLLISVEEDSAAYVVPDATRPHVVFLAQYNRGEQGDPSCPTGYRSEPIVLVKAGRREGTPSDEVVVETLFEPEVPSELTSPYVVIFQGLSPLQKRMLRLPSEDDSGEQPEDTLTRLLDASPAAITAHCEEGVRLASLGRPEEAIRCYNHALFLNPKHTASLINRAASLIRLNRNEEAIADCDTALSLDSKYAQAWHNKGIALLNTRRADDAVSCFQMSTELDPSLPNSWSSLGAHAYARAMDALKEDDLTRGIESLLLSAGFLQKALLVNACYAGARENLKVTISLSLRLLPFTCALESVILNASRVDPDIARLVALQLFETHKPKLHPRYMAEIPPTLQQDAQLLEDALRATFTVTSSPEALVESADSRLIMGLHLFPTC
jgi:tetratricopeptide (TPR) repeat protein